MQHLHTFYQDMDTEEVIAEIDDALVYIAPGTTVSCATGEFYEVKYTEDVIHSAHSVSRTIWLERH